MLKSGMSPAHPGAVLGGLIEGLREETGNAYTITEIAVGLGISRRKLAQLLNKKSSISPEIAVKLSEAFGTSADLWMNLQKKYDLWYAEKSVSREAVRHFVNIDAKNLQSAKSIN
ncbi:HigA family addiction module antitoxin [Dyadobacter sp. CY345]|uniref:HigA family addiction module antitoxin n=1 Tax=Dyadobacter sp. CY345 TaxID=2909335 RepID=UPI001F1FFBA6|nr:HigA family addiction module antitoxin [Dyadobacter sp. CY345]MCF2442905.1 HigA family addiction module antitoxin [Dyadobacter sp. CY345]